MSDWQPAVLVNAHNLDYAREKKWAGRKVLVRKTFPHNGTPHPCAGKDCWFEIHPEDSSIMVKLGRVVLCEHEILTD